MTEHRPAWLARHELGQAFDERMQATKDAAEKERATDPDDIGRQLSANAEPRPSTTNGDNR